MMSCLIHNQRCLEVGPVSSLPPQLLDSGMQKVHFFASGREALVALIQSMTITRSPVVLLPAFVPEGLYAPFAQAHWRIALYKVDRALNPVWDHLETLLWQHRPQMAILIHYFGLPKPIKQFVEICHSYNTLVVEDMAQAYLGETENGPLGQTGDFILYSLPKMIGVPEGAPLAIRQPSTVSDIPKPHESNLHRLYVVQQMITLATTTIALRVPTRAGRAGLSLLPRILAGSAYHTLMQYYTTPAPMSKASWFLLRHIDHQRLQRQRRRLARVYINGLDRSKFEFFPDAERLLNVMMGFPVLLTHRDAFVRYLARNSIAGVYFVDRWNFIPMGQEAIYSDAIEILRSHFLFPLHQRLSVAQVQQVVEVANSWSGVE
jgi:dTDP-4-amino-4,6-dideoxygalactose transaminase